MRFVKNLSSAFTPESLNIIKVFSTSYRLTKKILLYHKIALERLYKPKHLVSKKYFIYLVQNYSYQHYIRPWSKREVGFE